MEQLLPRTTRLQFLAQLAFAGLLSLLVATGLTLLASVSIVFGADYETIPVAEWLAPLLGVAAGAAWLGSRHPRHPRLAGLAVGLAAVAFWIVAYCFLMGRHFPVLWWREGLLRISGAHLVAWIAAVMIAVLAGGFGVRLREERPGPRKAVLALFVLLLPLAMIIASKTGHQSAVEDYPLAPGVDYQRLLPQADGTRAFLITADFAENPDLRLRLFDADSDDSTPLNDVNTTWFGQPLDLAMPRIQARAGNERTVICACNAGFFTFTKLRVGGHLAPLIIDGKALYPKRAIAFADQAWDFTMRRTDGRPQFAVTPARPLKDLERASYELAISAARPLRVNGKSLELEPGIGNTQLRCSRTSLGWSTDSGKLYMLFVIDPDGEYAGIQQKKHNRQTSGWDLPQLQRLWEQLDVPNAVIVDGGDSTQFAIRRPEGAYQVRRSGYQLSWTFGYLRNRPLRVFVPALPPAEAHVGVMNYLYLESKTLPREPLPESD